jgi:hypothetical protein
MGDTLEARRRRRHSIQRRHLLPDVAAEGQLTPGALNCGGSPPLQPMKPCIPSSRMRGSPTPWRLPSTRSSIRLSRTTGADAIAGVATWGLGLSETETQTSRVVRIWCARLVAGGVYSPRIAMSENGRRRFKPRSYPDVDHRQEVIQRRRCHFVLVQTAYVPRIRDPRQARRHSVQTAVLTKEVLCLLSYVGAPCRIVPCRRGRSWWAGRESNPHSRKTADLQSAELTTCSTYPLWSLGRWCAADRGRSISDRDTPLKQASLFAGRDPREAAARSRSAAG